MIKNVHWSSFKIEILIQFEFSRQIFKNTQISRKSVQWELSLSMWTDGHTDMMELIVAFRNFSNAPKNYARMYSGVALFFLLWCEEACASLGQTD